MAQGETYDEQSNHYDLVRKKAIRIYMVLSLVQFANGLGLIVPSSVATRYHYKGAGVPYYAGGFLIGGMLMFSCLLGFRVYNKGPLFSTCDEAEKEVRCAINWHRVTSFFMFLGSLLALAIIWMFGLCLQKDMQCSYENDFHENRTLAIIIFVMGSIGISTSAVGVVLIRKFSNAFGISFSVQDPGPWPSARYRRSNRGSTSTGQIQMDERRHSQLQNNPFALTFGESGGSGGVVNLAFVPPELPPYTPPADVSTELDKPPDFDTVVTSQIHVPTISYRVDSIPQEPPPPYTEH